MAYLKKLISHRGILFMAVYALIRVSTEEQDETRQVIEMTKLGIKKKISLLKRKAEKVQ